MDFTKMSERIIFARKNRGLNQEDFARELGLTKSAVSGYETGRRAPSDAVIRSIAREFHYNEEWLKTGQGEPEEQEPEDALGQIFAQYNCSKFEQSFLRSYFQFSEKERREFCAYLEKLFDGVSLEMGSKSANDEDDETLAQKAGELYLQELRSEKGQGSPISSANGSAAG